MIQPALRLRVATFVIAALVVLSAAPSHVDAYSFLPVFDDDVVACVHFEGRILVSLPFDAAALTLATGEPASLVPLGAVIDALPDAGAGIAVEFHGCCPEGAARAELDVRGYLAFPCPPLPGVVAQAVRYDR